MKTEGDGTMLGHCRVLDLTDEKGFLCGKVLADLGADVIKVEPPGGEPTRNRAPYYHDDADTEKSLYWFAYNAGKRSITLNIETKDGNDIFSRLVQTADFVIESFAPGHIENIGLGYDSLSKLNPRIILTSITPFGQNGPWRDYKTSDLVSMALSGYVFLTGDPDRAPVRVGFPQAYLHGGAAGAAGSLVAYHYRQATGEGQWVDVSIHEACSWIPLDSYNFWEITHLLERRHGSVRLRPETGAKLRRLWRCKDGWVNTELYGGALARAFTIPLTAWMAEEGMAPEWLKQMNWAAFDYSQAKPEEVDRIAEVVAKFFLNHTKAELWEGGIKRRSVVYPVASPREIAQNIQLSARDYWQGIEHPELGDTITYPGPWARPSETALKQTRKAPLIGEHNREVYSELGLRSEELVVLKQAGVI